MEDKIETNLNFGFEKIKQFNTKPEIQSLRIEVQVKYIINLHGRIQLKQIKTLILNIFGISNQSEIKRLRTEMKLQYIINFY